MLTFQVAFIKGVGEGGGGGGGAAGACAPALSKVGGTSGFEPPPPTFGQMKCSNFTNSSFFKLKNAKFSWLASLANLTLFIFSKLS